MKGYPTKNGYMGLTDTGWMLFSTESEYIEWSTDNNAKNNEAVYTHRSIDIS